MLLMTLMTSNLVTAAENTFILNKVKIKIPPECVIYNAEKHVLRCNLDPMRNDIHLGFYINKNFQENVIDNELEKNVQRIGDNDFVQFLIGGDPFNFLSLYKCNIILAGGDAKLLFSVMTEIKIDNEICR